MITGKSIIRGDESSLSLAKKVIFKFFDKNKLTLKEIRENEILEYIKNNLSISKWICVDDIYLGNIINNFIWCQNPKEGITSKNIKEKIISFIN